MASNRRVIDEYNEKYLNPLIDQVYEAIGLDVMDIDDKYLQVHGVDKILVDKAGNVIFTDEKADMKRQLTTNTYWADGACTTFAVELSRKNRLGVRGAGWFHPTERNRELNDYYTFVWCKCEKDSSDRFKKVDRMEVCVVSYDNLAKITGLTTTDVCDSIVDTILEDGERRHEWNSATHLIYSDYLFEQPINAVIKKWALRKNALYSCVVDFDGANGNEKVVRVENLH